MMPGSLLEELPAKWKTTVRPFLLRADEFEKQQPIVSYFLRTHVAYLCMKNHSRDKEDLDFLKKLLGDLENTKKLLTELENVDGQTVLTKYALMLFSKADNEERAGKANLNIVRLFFTSALLFEATTQFTKDGEMDPIPKEKCKYAKYTAASMNRALHRNEPYISRNQVWQAPSQETSGLHDETCSGETGEGHGSILSPSFPNSSPLLPPPAYSGGGYFQNAAKSDDNSSPSPSLTPPPYVSAVYPQPERARQEVSDVDEGTTPSLDAILDAQKSVSRAVAALQFNDCENARQFLLKALEFLDHPS